MPIISYQQAEEFFNKTKKPPRSKKYDENQRPLRRVSESQLMIQKDPQSYVLKICGVETVRYLKPESPDKFQIAVRGMRNTYEADTAYKFTGLYNGIKLHTTDGTEVRVPLNPRYADQDKDFSALLTFRVDDGLLILDESWHADIYTLRSTDEDKDKRKKLKADLEAYITLQQFKLPTLKDNAKIAARMGRPFGESNLSFGARAKMFTFLQQDVLPLELPEFALIFDELAQATFDTLASKVVYNTDRKLVYAQWGANPSEIADRQEKAQDIASEITPEQFKESLTNALLKIANISQGSSSLALPQFHNKLPRKYFLVSKGKS
jgi:hypothetical protein